MFSTCFSAVLVLVPHLGIQAVYLPPKLFLVHVTTAGFEQKKGCAEAKLRITKVLAGPDRLIGKEFGVNTEPQITGNFGVSRLQVGQLKVDGEGLWWVFEEGNDRRVAAMLDVKVAIKYGLVFFPYQTTKTAPFFDRSTFEFHVKRYWFVRPLQQKELCAEGEAFAKCVTEVYAAKSNEERKRLLEKFAATENSPVAGWAMALLSLGPRDAAVKHLRTLVEKRDIEPSSQLMLDEILSELDGVKWAASPERWKLFTRWLQARADNVLFEEGCAYISDMQEFYRDTYGLQILEALTVAVEEAPVKERWQAVVLSGLTSRLRFDSNDKKRVEELVARIRKVAKGDLAIDAVNDMKWWK